MSLSEVFGIETVIIPFFCIIIYVIPYFFIAFLATNDMIME